MKHSGKAALAALKLSAIGLGTVIVLLAVAVLARFIGRPTHLEAQLFGGWLHDDNFGMASVRRLAHSELFADGAYLDEEHMVLWSSLNLPHRT